eukprot:5127569-Ditylum_brightwellii.AAC.1
MEHYSSSMIHNKSTGKLLPQKVSNKQHQYAADTGHKGVLNEKWNKSTYTTYLKVNRINGKTILAAHEHSENCIVLASYNSNDSSNDDV